LGNSQFSAGLSRATTERSDLKELLARFEPPVLHLWNNRNFPIDTEYFIS
jgi:hypothetical protein